MLTIKNGLIFLLLLLISSSTILFSISCNNPTNNTAINAETFYEKYEMKANDIRLQFLMHPLFSFEYPKVFTLADLNKAPDLVINLDESVVDFGCNLSEVPYQNLSIIVSKPWPGHYNNANDKLNFLVSDTIMFTENVTTKKVMVSGIIADYLESFQKPLTSGKQYVYREVIFDNSDLIWEILMVSFSYYPEPSSVQEAFDHILSTFRILN